MHVLSRLAGGIDGGPHQRSGGLERAEAFIACDIADALPR
jgi:hypothetical protein